MTCQQKFIIKNHSGTEVFCITDSDEINSINALNVNFTNHVAYINNALNTETTARINADNLHVTNLNTEITNRTNGDNTLQTNIDNEASTRETADTLLQNNIDTVTTNLNTEASTRASSDQQLQTNIDNEITNRTNADTIIQNNLDTHISNYDDEVDTLHENDSVGYHGKMWADCPEWVWSNDQSYAVGDVVKWEGTAYYCHNPIASSHSGTMPGRGSTWANNWTVVLGRTPEFTVARYDNFSRYYNYHYGDVITAGGLKWMCNADRVRQIEHFGNTDSKKKWGPNIAYPESYTIDGRIIWKVLNEMGDSELAYQKQDLAKDAVQQHIDGQISIVGTAIEQLKKDLMNFKRGYSVFTVDNNQTVEVGRGCRNVFWTNSFSNWRNTIGDLAYDPAPSITDSGLVDGFTGWAGYGSAPALMFSLAAFITSPIDEDKLKLDPSTPFLSGDRITVVIHKTSDDKWMSTAFKSTDVTDLTADNYFKFNYANGGNNYNVPWNKIYDTPQDAIDDWDADLDGWYVS